MIDRSHIALRPDEHLEKLVAGVIEKSGIAPPEVLQRLRDPTLKVIKGPPGVNSLSVRWPDGTKAILLGAGLYDFLKHYTLAAATFFLPSKQGGVRPSPLWRNARASVAITLNWLASPARMPVYPKFKSTARQEQVADAITACAYRFALCHELAHVGLGHLDNELLLRRRLIEGAEVEDLKLSQNLESNADNLGLELHYKSLPEHIQIAPGLISSVYFCRATGLAVDIRLMLLSDLVDVYEWKILATHPPTLGRVFQMIGNAGRLYEYGKGLLQLNDDLAKLDMQIMDAANQLEEEVIQKVKNLIVAETACIFKQIVEGAEIADQVDEIGPKYVLRTSSIHELEKQFSKSPVGVLHALEPPDPEKECTCSDDSRLRSLVQEKFSAYLPPEFQDFRRLTKADRVKEFA